MSQQQKLFRQKALDRVSGPEQLNDYLRVMNPGVWMVLVVVIILLGSLAIWASMGKLETTAEVKVVVENHAAEVVSLGGEPMAEGMLLRVSGIETPLLAVRADELGRSIGACELALSDGIYDGVVVIELNRPIEFLWESR